MAFLLRISQRLCVRTTLVIGYTYDAGRDAFIPPKPYNSWVLNETPACGMRLLQCQKMRVRVNHLRDIHGMKRL
jgi:hypothetical protein